MPLHWSLLITLRCTEDEVHSVDWWMNVHCDYWYSDTFIVIIGALVTSHDFLITGRIKGYRVNFIYPIAPLLFSDLSLNRTRSTHLICDQFLAQIRFNHMTFGLQSVIWLSMRYQWNIGILLLCRYIYNIFLIFTSFIIIYIFFILLIKILLYNLIYI